MNKSRIAVFDFDGTLTTKDSFLEFIRFTHGTYKLYIGLLLHLPFIIAFKIRIYSNEKTKQMIFKWFYKGMPYQTFKRKGIEFSGVIDSFVNLETLRLVDRHRKENDLIFVVSASVEEWVSPWCHKNGLHHVIGTKVDIDEHGRLTGLFSTPNCYGMEKVRRFSEMEPERNSFILFAYGDSRGDKEMIEFADYGQYI